jgi:3-deoxy-D-manno-octulosonic-acid transferase
MFNFKEISEALIQAGGGLMVKDKEELYIKLDNLLSNKQLSSDMGEKAFKVIVVNSGATARTIDAIHRLIIAQ